MINKNYSQISSDIDMSAAIEFIHGATLLHDDVIDEVNYEEAKRVLTQYGIISLVFCLVIFIFKVVSINDKS